MELDDLKNTWAAHTAAIDRNRTVSERLLREVLVRKAGRALWPLALTRAVEIALAAAGIAVVVPLLAQHVAEPRYLVAGLPVLAYLVAFAALSVRLLVRALAPDVAAPVAELQSAVARLQIAEFRRVGLAVLGGVVVWLPLPLLLFEGATGVAALARVDLAWLVGNVAFGVVAAGAAVLAARRIAARPDLGPFVRRIVDGVSGRGILRARAHLDELAELTRAPE